MQRFYCANCKKLTKFGNEYNNVYHCYTCTSHTKRLIGDRGDFYSFQLFKKAFKRKNQYENTIQLFKFLVFLTNSNRQHTTL